MPFRPWTQQATLPPGAPQEQPPKEFTDKELEDLRTRGFGERMIQMFQGGQAQVPEEAKFQPTMTWPWQAEHYDKPGGEAAKWALGIGLGSAGLATGLAIPGLLGAASQYAPWLTGAALKTMGPLATAGLGGVGALTGTTIAGRMTPEAPTTPPPGQPGEEPTGPPGTGPTEGESRVNYGPTGIPFLETWDGTKWVGPDQPEGEAGVPTAQPQVQEIGGQKFWWDPSGGMYGTGGWSLIPSRAETLTPEQQIKMTEAERAHQMEMLQEQGSLEQQLMNQQNVANRGQQEASAAQQMAQMYAADPYKYWAQMGQGTPPAVARLQGSQGGGPASNIPLSTPSAQWWGNLLPSEQQQISGGLNWMGVDPQDWYSMYQRMIPGMGSRQMGPAWAR